MSDIAAEFLQRGYAQGPCRSLGTAYRLRPLTVRSHRVVYAGFNGLWNHLTAFAQTHRVGDMQGVSSSTARNQVQVQGTGSKYRVLDGSHAGHVS